MYIVEAASLTWGIFWWLGEWCCFWRLGQREDWQTAAFIANNKVELWFSHWWLSFIILEQFNVLNYLGLGGSPWVVIGWVTATHQVATSSRTQLGGRRNWDTWSTWHPTFAHQVCIVGGVWSASLFMHQSIIKVVLSHPLELGTCRPECKHEQPPAGHDAIHMHWPGAIDFNLRAQGP